MAVTVTHSTVATLPDEAGAEVNKAEWNAAHTVVGLGTFADQNFATPPAIGGTTPAAVTGTTITATTGFLAPDGTINAPGIGWASDNDGTGAGWWRSAADTWTFVAGAGTNQLTLTTNSTKLPSGGALQWTASADSTAAADTTISRVGVNSLRFGSTAATTTARTEMNKAVTAFTDAVAKATFTITIPNAAHSASLVVKLIGSLGAGGAIGANEATATNTYDIVLTRTAGVNAVATISAAYGAAAAAVAGAATVTCTAAMSAVTGAVGASNSFTVDVTITKSGGASANHTCLCYGQLMNANATGITIA